MTSREKTIVQALIALAWADGSVEGPETSVVEGLLAGFDASPEEEKELLAYAKGKPPSLDDLKLGALNEEERDILLGNAALLVQADGAESPVERKMLEKLARVLGLDADEARRAVQSTRRPVSKR